MEAVEEAPGARVDTEREMIDDATISQLFGTLIWQAYDGETGELLGSLGYGRSDMSREDQATLIEEFREFLITNSADVDAYMDHLGYDMTDVAHDYVLTRNRHGAGFWDRCHCGGDEAAKRLTDAAHSIGELTLLRDDDGSLSLN